jgi:hypothetical protein
MARTWIVTPVFHDVPAFRRLHADLLDVITADARLRERATTIVVVDDSAGRDPEMRGLDDLEHVEVVEPPFNLGHQRAIVYALRQLAERIDGDDLVVTLDSDGEDRPSDIPALTTALLEDPDDTHAVALARRTARQETAAFKVGYRAFTLLFRALTGTVIRSGNFAAYRGTALRVIRSHPYFDLSYSASLTAVGFNVRYVPCPRGSRYAGQSRMNFQRLMLHGLSMLVPFTDHIALRAMVLYTATLVVSAVVAVAVLAVKLFSDAAIPGWATYTILAMFLASLIALGNVVILFVVFSQSRGVSLAALEGSYDHRPEDTYDHRP